MANEAQQLAGPLVRARVTRATAGNLQVLLVLLLQDVKGVVHRDDAEDLAGLLVHDGHGKQVVLGDVLGHVLLVVVGLGRDDLVIACELAQRVGRVGDEQVAHRHHAGKLAGLVGDVDVVDRLEVVGQGAHPLGHLGHGDVARDGYELRGHDASGSVVLVAQQLANGALLVDAHEAQELLGAVVVELAHELGGVVRVHLGQHARGVGVGHAAHDLGGHLVVVELGHGLGRLVVVELGKHLAAQARVELLDDVGDVGRVQVVERLVRDRQLHVGEVAVNEVHVVPRDDLLGNLVAEGVGQAKHQLLEGGREGAQDAADAHLGAEQAQLRRAGVGELEVVHAHDAHAARVDDLLVEQVATDEDLVGLQVGEADVGGGDGEANLVVIERVDVLAPADHERGLAGPLERERRDAGEDLARGDAEVVHHADLLAVGVEDGVSQHLGQVDHCAPSREPMPGGRRQAACRMRTPGGRAWPAPDTPCGAAGGGGGASGGLPGRRVAPQEHVTRGHRLSGRGFINDPSLCLQKRRVWAGERWSCQRAGASRLGWALPAAAADRIRRQTQDIVHAPRQGVPQTSSDLRKGGDGRLTAKARGRPHKRTPPGQANLLIA